MPDYCRECGAPLAEGSTSCEYCGSPVPGKEIPAMKPVQPKFCRSCGRELTPGARFCRGCGWEVGTPVQKREAARAGEKKENKRDARASLSAGSVKSSGSRKASEYSGGYGTSGKPASSRAPKKSPVMPLAAAVLAVTMFTGFIYPGFIRTGLSGFSGRPSGNGFSLIGKTENEPGGKTQAGSSGGQAANVPSPEQLAEEYAAIDAAYADGTLFLEEESGEVHGQYSWLYGDGSGWEIPEEPAGSEVTVLPEGKSRSFRKETPYGITISAEENALDKDREFTLKAVSDKQFDDCEKTVSEAAGNAGYLLDVWELDAGMADDEMLPGHYTMEFDLDKLGLDEEDYEDLRFYRIDDSGKWYEYPSRLEGKKAVVEANQNSLIGAAVVGAAIASVTYDTLLGIRSGAYFNPFTGVFDLEYNGEKVMQVMLNRSSFFEALQSGNSKHYSELDEAAKQEAYQQIKKEEDLDFENLSEMNKEFNKNWVPDPELSGAAARIRKSFKKRYEAILKEKLDKDPDYKRIKKNLEDYNRTKDCIPDFKVELEAVSKVCESALRAWKWLKEDQGLRMPKYKFRIELSGDDVGAYGATQTPILGNPYMVLSMSYLGRGDQLTYDRLLCTVAHEMFHAVQRVYVSNALGTYKFDEMTAMDVEGMAYDHFKEAEVNPILSSREAVLDNLTDAYYFAIPLDDFKTSYPEGTISGSGDKASASYPVAPIVTYLRKDYWSSEVKYPDILTRYHSLWGKRAVTTILKTAFTLGSGEDSLTEAYQRFSESYQTRFYKEALKKNANEIFAPLTPVNGSSGRQKVDLLNKNYTIRVRRVRPTRWDEKWKEYALVLKYDEDFKDAMSDFVITPLNKKEEEDFRKYADGLFFEPKEWGSDEETVYLMETDGGTGKNSEGMIWNSYSGYTLYLMVKPDQPEVTPLGDKLSVKLPIFGEWPGHEVVDSYVVTLRTGKTDVLQQQFMKKDVDLEPVEIDISNLKINGKKLTEEQKKNLCLILQECVENTYKTGNPCLGPESDPVPLSGDIYGTWEIQSAMENYSSPMMDQFVGLMGAAAGSAAGSDAVGEAVGDALNSYIDSYNAAGQAQASAVTTGKMVISPTDKKGIVKAVVKFEEGPEQTYEGPYDDTLMLLKLEPKDTMYTDSKGNTYDLKKFGLAAGMELWVSKDVNESDPDHPLMTFTGESSMDNQFASFKTTLTGTKISDEY